MKITAEKDEQSQYIVRIEIDPAELDAAKGKAAKRLSNRVNIRGFRPGKAPRALVERFVGQEALIEEATRDLMPKAYKEALDQENIKPIGDPDFKIDSLDPLVLVATIPVEPTVNLGSYQEIKFDMPVTEDNPEEVEKTIQQLLDQNSTWEEPEEERPAQDGDQVEVELQTVRDGEVIGEPFTRSGVLGKGELLEQMDEQVVGMAVGEERVIEIARRKPETEATDATEKSESATDSDDAAVEGEAAALAAANAVADADIAPKAEADVETSDLPEVEIIPLDPEEEDVQANKPLTFQVKLNSIKVKHEPELNDEFAASVSDLKTMDELRERIRKNLKAQTEANTKRELVDKIVKEAVALSEVVMPPVMINAEIHALEDSMNQRLKQQKLSLDQYLQFTGKSHDDFHEELRPQAEDRIRTALVLREIAQAENIAVDETDIDREMNKLVREYTANIAEENQGAETSRMRELFNRKETRDRISDDLFSRKLGDRLIELATGVKPTEEDDEDIELELTDSPNAATEASQEKLERTQGDIEMTSESDTSDEDTSDQSQSDDTTSDEDTSDQTDEATSDEDTSKKEK